MSAATTTIMTKSQLSELALDAAIQLDRAERSDDPDISLIENFLDAIKAQLQDEANTSIFRDSTLYPVYSYALAQSSGDEIVRKEDFVSNLNRSILSRDAANADQPQLESLKSFCLAVHEALLLELMGRRLASVRQDERIR